MGVLPFPIRPATGEGVREARSRPFGARLRAAVAGSGPRLAGCLALAAIYAGAAMLPLGLWAPTGIALGVLLRWGPGLWPGIALGALVAHLHAGIGPWAAMAFAAGNSLEAVIGVAMLRHLELRNSLERVRDVSALVLAGAIVATAIGASVRTLTLWLAGHGDVDPMTTWVLHWCGGAVGVLLVVPIFLTGLATLRALTADPAGALAIGAVLLAVLLLGFGHIGGISTSAKFLAFPVVVWAAVRLKVAGAVAATVATAAFCLVSTAAGHGPLAGHEPLLLSYVAAVAVTALVTGAAISQGARALMLRDEFAAIASHELRTPVAALYLRIDAARHHGGQPCDQGLQHGLRSAAVQVRRLARVVDGLLDASRARAGCLELDRQVIDLAEVVRGVLAELDDELQVARCPVEVAGDRRLLGCWDRIRLEQVLANLLAEAARHGRGHPIGVALHRSGNVARLSISIGGAPIPIAERERIFSPFEGGGPNGRSAIGLGLYVARAIVVAHGGALELEDSPHGATMFVVELPAISRPK